LPGVEEVGADAKKKSVHASEQSRPDVAEARAAWHEIALADVAIDKLVFIDESGSTTAMQRLRGRSPRGERCVASGPGGHWKICTMIGAVRLDGPLVCSTLDGSVDQVSFTFWVKEDLCPALRPGDVVCMDNLSSHLVPAVREAIELAGARLIYLPPYSPDFNPIENLWSKVKEALRAAAQRTFAALGEAVASAYATVTSQDCRGYFENCGYAI
jgi:transposase